MSDKNNKNQVVGIYMCLLSEKVENWENNIQVFLHKLSQNIIIYIYIYIYMYYIYIYI